ncbi:Crp/Fnr family transcriptional regulator [Solitalea lacus]|uniref:Crp/Fnr family transcriptional regulator n=1 Tax=Solitalea lacus TaxID=2911172 RepID=UPI001EDB6A7B|nr:Crp/Fnr family transcriptional regulator [Solitalea lacus]UKJ06454.1 Crp/Fnr family transcriptional regulator [Solitalea lacus]
MSQFEIQPYLSLFHPLSDDARKAILNVAELKEYPAKTVLLSEGSIQKNVLYLNKGLVRGYFHMEDKEVTLWICYDPDSFGDPESFFHQVPTDLTIETLEPSQVVLIPRQSWLELFDKFPEIERASRLVSQSNVQKLYRRIKVLNYSTPEEKYRYLLENEAQIIQRTPLKFIASYLNITPETLSRIRAKIYQTKE